MELLLLGTAAADQLPSPYCDCAVCTEARRRGGPNLRSHSGALIDDDLKIDHGPGTKEHMLRTGRSLGKIRTVLFTHQHPDHLYAVDLKRASPPYTTTRGDEPIVVYGNEHVLAEVRRALDDPAKWRIDPRLLRPLKPVTHNGDTFLPLPAAHAPGALLFRITRGGKSIFYGHDSGYYPQETMDALGDGVPLDVALMDCTHGGKVGHKCEHHMTIEAILRMTGELRRRGTFTDRTRIIATHFSHGGGMLHEDLVRALLPHGIEVAYDGMVVRL